MSNSSKIPRLIQGDARGGWTTATIELLLRLLPVLSFQVSWARRLNTILCHERGRSRQQPL